MNNGKTIGYTTGVFDMFHIGHLNVLRNAKQLCDYLIVGVSTDSLVTYKNTECIIPFEQRVEIVRSIRWVDAVIPQKNMDKVEAWKKLKFDIMFVGDDWYGNGKWNNIENDLKPFGVSVVYLPYTQGISSTELKSKLIKAEKLNEIQK
jgi:glycerol-3-phosphate cytidylyltransferase